MHHFEAPTTTEYEKLAKATNWVDDAFVFKSASRLGGLDQRAPILRDATQIERKRIFFAGGCEFVYPGYFLTAFGHDVFDTFQANVAGDPVGEFIGSSGSHAAAFQPDLIVMSAAQSLVTVLKKTSGLLPYGREQQEADIQQILDGLEASVTAAREVLPGCRIALMSHLFFRSRMFNFYEEAILERLQGDSLSLGDIERHFRLGLSRLARRHDTLLLDAEEAISAFGKVAGNPLQDVVRPNDLFGGHPYAAGGRILANVVNCWLQAIWPPIAKIKAIICDLDNTLWDGVVREDGIDHVRGRLRNVPLDVLSYFAKQGFLIALCSKNDPEIEQRLPEILPQWFMRNVVASRVNWQPKSDNITSIVEELNIGADTIAFFDDQEFERAQVLHDIPDVRVFSDADLYQIARYTPFLPSSPPSRDAQARTASYVAERERKVVAQTFSKDRYADFLVSCGFKLKLFKADQSHLPRVAELIQRTNQQNLTLQRIPQEDLATGLRDDLFDIWCCETSDRFGDYGVIGTILVEETPANRTAAVRELAFSCRAMGKGIEKAFLQRIISHYGGRNLERLTLDVIATSKNGGMIEIAKGAGFAEGSRPGRLEVDLRTERGGYDQWITWT